MSLDLINGNGVCCALHVSYPRFRDRISPELWGFSLESATARAALKPPSVRLLVDAMSPIVRAETSARKYFGVGTLSMGPGLAGLRFCPYKGLPRLLSSMKEAEEVFRQAAAAFVTDFDDTMKTVRAQWTETMEEQTDVPRELRAEILEIVLEKLPVVPPRVEDFKMITVVSQLKTVDTPDIATLTLEEQDAVIEASARASQYADTLSRTFTDRCRAELYGRLHEFFSGLQGLVEAGKPINLRTVKRVRDFLDSMKALNFTNDTLILQMTGGITSAFGPDFTSASSAIRDEDVIQSVRSCIENSLKALGSEMKSEGMDSADDRMEAILGSTPVSKEESDVLGIEI